MRTSGNKGGKFQTLYFTSLALLIIGACNGFFTAYCIELINIDLPRQLEKARSLGITSISILNDHSESEDILTYGTVFGLPVLCAAGFWFLWARARWDALQPLFPVFPDARYRKDWSWRAALLAVSLFGIYYSFNINNVYAPTAHWYFLGEEGEVSFWAQRIMNGGIYGKDFYCIYGPLLVYPLAWVMKLCGATIPVMRFYALGLNFISYGIIIAFLYLCISRRSIFVAAVLIYLAAFDLGYSFSPLASYLRVTLGLLPILLCFLSADRGRPHLRLLTGGAIGISFLFSQEVAICSLVSVLAVALLRGIAEKEVRGLFRTVGLYLAGWLVAVAPFFIYFALQGALGHFVKGLYTYPKLFSAGFEGIPFPEFTGFLREPLGSGLLLFYWVILVYVIAAIGLLPALILRRTDRHTMLRLAVLIFGVLLYRSVLGRSDEWHALQAAPPAFLLAFLQVDAWLTACRRQDPAPVRWSRIGQSALLAGTLCMVFLYSGILSQNLSCIPARLAAGSQKWHLVVDENRLPCVERSGGVCFDADLAATIRQLDEFLDANTTAREYVYFFPNEAAYYFLFNRRNPTKFSVSYLAATRRQRLGLVRDLERHRPRYVVYSLGTWRIDEIPEDVQVPEVLDYLKEHYQPDQEFGDVLILKRNDA